MSSDYANHLDPLHGDFNVPENYIAHILKTTKPLPPITWKNFWTELKWVNVIKLTVLPALAIYGLLTTELRWQTAVFSFVYFQLSGSGITAGYHRLWAHRSYTACKGLEYFLAVLGAGCIEGTIMEWASEHRSHHRYTDTDLDPYGVHRGLLWAHIGWLIVKPRLKPGFVVVSDLANSKVVQWQYKYYWLLVALMVVLVPTTIAGFGWGDWKGGLLYAGAARVATMHQVTYCINSLAHHLGERPFDDKKTARDHFLIAFITGGEGYHNFHHQFPTDYRNGFMWYHYDPTKWFIGFCRWLGLATSLQTFPENEIKKGQLNMKLKELRRTQDEIQWPTDSEILPVITWEAYREQSAVRPLILVAGFIHDVSTFMDKHPGGRQLLSGMIGKDATSPFFGGVYEHSNAAHNLLGMMRVGVLHGGMEVCNDRAVARPEMLRIVRADGISPN